MNLKKKLLVLFILSCLMIPSLHAQETNPLKMNKEDFLKKELKLNDSQIEKIKAIISDSFKQVELKHIELERTNLDLREELLKGGTDLAKIKNFIDKKNYISGDIELLDIKRNLAIKALLTPEQFMKWKMFEKPIMHRPNNEMFMPMMHNNDLPMFGFDKKDNFINY